MAVWVIYIFVVYFYIDPQVFRYYYRDGAYKCTLFLLLLMVSSGRWMMKISGISSLGELWP